MSKQKLKKIYYPKKNVSMNVIVFASGGGGNLKATIDFSIKHPKLAKVRLVVTDRLGIPAIDIAESHGIRVLAYDFEKECGKWIECRDDSEKIKAYTKAAIRFHDNVLEDILLIEQKNNAVFDLVVLSYHRWIQGRLFKYFEERMINQHAGDLTIMKRGTPLVRRYIGINPVLMALRDGANRTRTSTFLVRNNHDGGEILCQGPYVQYTGQQPVTKESAWQHELIQKRESDWPSLTFSLRGIAEGNFGISDQIHADGCKMLSYENRILPYGGIDLSI